VRRLVFLLLLASCSEKVENRTPEQRGESIVSDPRGISPSQFNPFACTTCHAKPGDDVASRRYPGAPLEGAASRKTFWGGRFSSLADAVGECVTHFQRASEFDPQADASRDLYAYLVKIGSTGQTGAVPFTVVRSVADVPRGDAARGANVWNAACRSCHGEPHTGAGRISDSASIVPEATRTEHGRDGPDIVRLVVIEKIRHGSYLGFPGTMPPFSTETLSDAEIGDLLAHLGL
jgi:thiosulfate dehydrogenase